MPENDGDSPPPDPLDVGDYLRSGGIVCPECKLPGVWHNHQWAQHEKINGVGVLFLPCRCTRCDAHWAETYRLVHVDRAIPTARAVAKTMYDSPFNPSSP